MIIGFAGEKVLTTPVVPPQGRHQRGRQAVRARSSSAMARNGRRPSSPRRPRTSSSTSRGRQDRHLSRKRRAGQDRHQRFRARSPAVDPGAGQAARLAGRPEGRCSSPRSRTAVPAEAAGIQEGDVITKVIRNQQDPAADHRQGLPGPRLQDQTSWPSYVQTRQGRAVRRPVQEREVTRALDVPVPLRMLAGRRRKVMTLKNGAVRTKPDRPLSFMIIQIDPSPRGRSR